MKKILFVDDEPHVLDALRRMLHHMRQDWDTEFVLNAGEALDRLTATVGTRCPPFDVVVSDMRMPGMDGRSYWSRCEGNLPPRSASCSRGTAIARP